MLDVLRFVRGAVSTKDLVPVLTHFCIEGGRIQGQNGRLALDAACPDLGTLDVVVPADKFLKAVDACVGEVAIHLVGSKLRVSSGRFQATMDVLTRDQYPLMEVGDEVGWVNCPAGFLDALKKIEPFISEDASRPWSCSVLVTKDRMYATNNAVLACVDFDWQEEDVVLPAFTVQELLRIGKMPDAVWWDTMHFVAEYDDGSWMKSQLVDGGWPTTLCDLYQKIEDEDSWVHAWGSAMVEALEVLKPFFPNPKIPVVLCSKEGIATEDGQSSAQVMIAEWPATAFRFESLSLVMTVATHWAPQRWPGPVPWKGEGICGMLSGVRR